MDQLYRARVVAEGYEGSDRPSRRIVVHLIFQAPGLLDNRCDHFKVAKDHAEGMLPFGPKWTSVEVREVSSVTLPYLVSRDELKVEKVKKRRKS